MGRFWAAHTAVNGHNFFFLFLSLFYSHFFLIFSNFWFHCFFDDFVPLIFLQIWFLIVFFPKTFIVFFLFFTFKMFTAINFFSKYFSSLFSFFLVLKRVFSNSSVYIFLIHLNSSVALIKFFHSSHFLLKHLCLRFLRFQPPSNI